MKAEIRDIIEGVIRDRFADVEIVSIDVQEDKDFDGDPIFRVKVVFNSADILDPHKTVGVLRHLRHKLLDRNEETFPILSFVSKSDDDASRAAA